MNLKKIALVAAFGLGLANELQAKPHPNNRKFTAERLEKDSPVEVQRACLAAGVKKLTGKESKKVSKAVSSGDAIGALSHLDLQHRAAFAILQEIAKEEYGTSLSIPELMSLINHESGWKSAARSDTTAVGLGQFVPMTFGMEMARHKEIYESLLCEDLPDPKAMNTLYLKKYRSRYNNNWKAPNPKKDPEAHAEYQEMKAFFDLRQNDVLSIVAMGIHWLNLKRSYMRYNQGHAGESLLDSYSESEDKPAAWKKLSWHQQEHPRTTKIRKMLSDRNHSVPVGQLKVHGKLASMPVIAKAFADYDKTLAAKPESKSLALVAKTRLFSRLALEQLNAPDYTYPESFRRRIKAIGRKIRSQGERMETGMGAEVFSDFVLVDQIGPSQEERIQQYMEELKAEQKRQEDEKRTVWHFKAMDRSMGGDLTPSREVSAVKLNEGVYADRVRREVDSSQEAQTAHLITPKVVEGRATQEYKEFLSSTENYTAILEWLKNDPLVGQKIARYSQFKDWSRARRLMDVLNDLEAILPEWQMDYLEDKIRMYHDSPEIGRVEMESESDQIVPVEPVLQAAQIHTMDGSVPEGEEGQILEDLVLEVELAERGWKEVSTTLESSNYTKWVTDYKDYGSRLNTLGDFFINLKAAVDEGEICMRDLLTFKNFLENEATFKAASIQLSTPSPVVVEWDDDWQDDEWEEDRPTVIEDWNDIELGEPIEKEVSSAMVQIEEDLSFEEREQLGLNSTFTIPGSLAQPKVVHTPVKPLKTINPKPQKTEEKKGFFSGVKKKAAKALKSVRGFFSAW